MSKAQKILIKNNLIIKRKEAAPEGEKKNKPKRKMSVHARENSYVCQLHEKRREEEGAEKIRKTDN